jgi:hypothetical protein
MDYSLRSPSLSEMPRSFDFAINLIHFRKNSVELRRDYGFMKALKSMGI